MGKFSSLVVLFICLINLGFGFGGTSGEKACNGTVGDCFSSGGGDVEFLGGGEEAGDLLRHYAAGARWLLASGGKTSYGTLMSGKGVCPADKYANCLVRGKKDTRPCLPYQGCRS